MSDGPTNGGETTRPMLFQPFSIRDRQSQFNPNIAHHWAHELGINRRFEDWSPEFGWWLDKRIKTLEGFATPTGAVTTRA